MPLQTKTEAQTLTDTTTVYANQMTIATGQTFSPNLPSGDPALALFQAVLQAMFMFLQAVALQLYYFSKAATSYGPDLDSWMADYGLTREQATYADGAVQFNAGTVKTSNILIAPGVVVQTLNTLIQYQVIADTTNTAWNSTKNAYILPAGSLSINVTMQALTAGSVSNVQAGQLNQLATSVPGIAFVTNLAVIENGDDGETDPEFRARFKLEISAPAATGSLTAVLAAVADVQQGLNVSLVENTTYNGAPVDLLVVIDDGSGATPSGTLNAVAAAIAPIRGAGINVVVVAATALLTTAALNIRIATGAQTQTVSANVVNAILDYINSLAIGAEMYLSDLTTVAKAADSNVISIQPGSALLQGNSADLTCSTTQVIRSNNTLINCGVY
jgi:uncharacterized phage protein gp47/JayE